MKKIFERFKKGEVLVGSPEYERLLALEVAAWRNVNPQNEGGWAALKKTIGYQTYRKGIIESEFHYIASAGSDVQVLELGSADGWMSNEILTLKNVSGITSIDISLEGEVVGAYNKRIRTVKGDLNQMDKIDVLKDEKFKCVITRGTLHHLVDPLKTMNYVVDHLLASGGTLIIEDTWIRQPSQLRVNAILYSLFYKIPHSLRGGFHSFVSECSHFLQVLVSTHAAEASVHNHSFSPFESISCADDYRDLYQRPDLQLQYFKNFAALPAWHYTYPGRWEWFGRHVIQPIDNFLLKSKLLCGDAHLAVFKKVK